MARKLVIAAHDRDVRNARFRFVGCGGDDSSSADTTTTETTTETTTTEDTETTETETTETEDTETEDTETRPSDALTRRRPPAAASRRRRTVPTSRRSERRSPRHYRNRRPGPRCGERCLRRAYGGGSGRDQGRLPGDRRRVQQARGRAAGRRPHVHEPGSTGSGEDRAGQPGVRSGGAHAGLDEHHHVGAGELLGSHYPKNA